MDALGALSGAAVTLAGALRAQGLIGRPVEGQLPSLWGWSLIMMGVALVLGSASDLIVTT